MLDTLRRQGSSVFIYVIFGILIAVFIINFGPQGGRDGGCRGGGGGVMSVDGNAVSENAYRIAFSNPFNEQQGSAKTYSALEMVIRRELLANEAEARGLAVSKQLVEDEIKRGNFYVAGQRVPLRGYIFDTVEGQTFFSYPKFKNFVSMLNVSTNAYYEEQERGIQAALMAEQITDAVQVSRNEAMAEFEYDGTRATYNTVTFQPSAYRAAMHLTDADVQRFAAAHAAEISARFTADAATYKGRKPEVKLREIVIAKGDGTVDQARAKLEAIRAQLQSGKLAFDAAAKASSTDDASKLDGGLLGWRQVDSPQLGDKAANDTVKAMRAGDLSPVISGAEAAYLLKIEDKREGDLKFDQVKDEIARDMAKDVWSKEAARRAAIEALAQVNADKAPKKLTDLFETAPPRQDESSEQPGAQNIDIQQMLDDPNVPEDKKAKIRQMLESMQQGSSDPGAPALVPADGSGGLQLPPTGSAAGSGAPAGSAAGSAAPGGSGAGSAAPASHGSAEKTGMADGKTVDIPVAWYADSDGPSSSAGSAMASGSGSAAASVAGSASGSGSAAAAGSGSAAPVVPVVPVDLMKPSDEQLPAFGTVVKPKIELQSAEPRSNKMEGIAGNKLAPEALFTQLADGQVAKTIYEADGAYVIVQLVKKETPNLDEFDKEADRRIEIMRVARQRAALDGWLKEKCIAAAQAGKIVITTDHIRETDDKGKPLPVTYRPCMSFQ